MCHYKKFKHKNYYLFNKNDLNFLIFQTEGYNPNKEIIDFFK